MNYGSVGGMISVAIDTKVRPSVPKPHPPTVTESVTGTDGTVTVVTRDKIESECSFLEKVIYEAEIEHYFEKKQELKNYMNNLYFLILGRCTQMMRLQLQRHPKFEPIDTAVDALSLVQLISLISHNVQHDQNIFLSVTNITRDLLTIRQGHDQSLYSYRMEFNNLVDVLLQLGGGHVWEYESSRNHTANELYGKSFEDCTTEEKLVVNRQVKDRTLAMIFFNGGHPKYFHNLRTDLAIDYDRNVRNNIYPTSVDDAFRLMQRWMNVYTDHQS
jgi:hypothetical protein